VRLTADASTISTALARLLVLEAIGSLAVLAAAAVLLRWVLGRALRPLDRMTRIAARIAGGRTDERLHPDRVDTELGRMAGAFDAMLDSLQAALAASQASEVRMREFLSDASHELRTPIAALQATAEVLLRGEERREEREALAVQMIRQAGRAGRLVDDLLSMARLDQGLALDERSYDLAGLLDEEAARARLLAPKLTIELDHNGPYPMRGDPQRIGQAIANLLDNARHATPDGGTIAITLNDDEAPAKVIVTDTGPGVPAADRERIFERFTRLEPSRIRHQFGNGLGLAIARGIAHAHHGTLTCVPSPHGAKFILTLPSDPARFDGDADPDALT